MADFEEQFKELLQEYPEAKYTCEGGRNFVLLPKLILPEGCSPQIVDALLCPHERDGYASRLFYAQRIEGIPAKNWNGSIYMCDQTWVGYSWKASAGHTLSQMIAYHLYTLNQTP